MAVHDSPAARGCWGRDGLDSILSICDYMSQIRFEQIKRYSMLYLMMPQSTIGPQASVGPAFVEAYRVTPTHPKLTLCECRNAIDEHLQNAIRVNRTRLELQNMAMAVISTRHRIRGPHSGW